MFSVEREQSPIAEMTFATNEIIGTVSAFLLPESLQITDGTFVSDGKTIKSVRFGVDTNGGNWSLIDNTGDGFPNVMNTRHNGTNIIENIFFRKEPK
jgi:hypothetical protein